MSNRALWTTKDGIKIPIREMTDSHILNTVRFLECMASELTDDGGCPCDGDKDWCFCYRSDYISPQDVHPRYRDLVNEAKRRKLWEHL